MNDFMSKTYIQAVVMVIQILLSSLNWDVRIIL